MIKKFILAAFITLIGFAIYLYLYLGANKEVTLTVAEQGPLVLLYADHAGAYHEIGKKIEYVEKWAREKSLPCRRTFGEYLDDPSAVDQDRLRSRGGCVLEQKIEEFPEDMKLEERPRRRYVVARFEGSPAIGPFTVYPKAAEYIETMRLKSDGPAMEIYTIQGTAVTTEFLFPVAPPPAP